MADFLLPMLRWDHEKRASAQEMLQHPWLNLKDNYDFRLTKRQIESMLLKKDTVKQGSDDRDDREMNELIESDPEIYAGDSEDTYGKNKRVSRRDMFKREMQGQTANMPGLLSQTVATDKQVFTELFDETEVSLIDPDEERQL